MPKKKLRIDSVRAEVLAWGRKLAAEPPREERVRDCLLEGMKEAQAKDDPELLRTLAQLMEMTRIKVSPMRKILLDLKAVKWGAGRIAHWYLVEE